MNDQAESLRMLLQTQEKKKGTAKAIAVVSGKGGVGKSNFSLNYSIALSKKGYRVLLLDMDIGMGNLDILMGRSAEKTMGNYLSGSSLTEVVMDGPEGLKYVAGGTGLSGLVKLDGSALPVFMEELNDLFEDYDYLIFDMGAGASSESLQFLLSVHEIFVITTPEPTSLTDAYAMIKYLHVLGSSTPFYLIANRAHSQEEGLSTLNKLANVSKKFLGRDSILLGVLPDDRAVQTAVSRQIPFLINNPKSPASKSLLELVGRYEEYGTKAEADISTLSFVQKLKKLLFQR